MTPYQAGAASIVVGLWIMTIIYVFVLILLSADEGRQAVLVPKLLPPPLKFLFGFAAGPGSGPSLCQQPYGWFPIFQPFLFSQSAAYVQNLVIRAQVKDIDPQFYMICDGLSSELSPDTGKRLPEMIFNFCERIFGGLWHKNSPYDPIHYDPIHYDPIHFMAAEKISSARLMLN